MFRTATRRTPSLFQSISTNSIKHKIPRRYASGSSGEHGKSSDLPWAVPALAITVPVCIWLWSTTPKMEPDHRWERRAKRLEEARKAKEHEEEEQHEEETKEEEQPEESAPPPQATGEDNVEASKAKEESAESTDKVEATGKGDTFNKQEGVSNAPTKTPRKTASSGPPEADTDEPTAKSTTTVDPSGDSETKKKLDAQVKGKGEKK